MTAGLVSGSSASKASTKYDAEERGMELVTDISNSYFPIDSDRSYLMFSRSSGISHALIQSIVHRVFSSSSSEGSGGSSAA